MKKKVISLIIGLALLADVCPALAQTAPAVTTLFATDVTTTNATINGTVNPDAAATTAYFQYGLDTNYGDIGEFTVLPAANTVFTMPGFVVNSITGPGGSQWTQSGAPSLDWQAIASSADGTRLAAVIEINSGGIYTSTNSGGTWTQSSAPNEYWQAIDSSADGTRLAAAVYGGGIFISTDSGETWTQSSAPGAYWYAIASSADGMRLAAVINGGDIYTSTDGGTTWTQSGAPSTFWDAIASSADGTRLAADSGSGNIFISANGGVTWTLSSDLSVYWYSIASSADGMRLAAGIYGGGIYTSTDGGGSWTQSSAPTNNWYSIASSADGTRLAAAGSGGIYTSIDSGVTWTQASAPSESWQTITCSADGTQLAAVVDGGGIYTSTGAISSLSPNSTYHFRLVGINSAGTTLGGDMTFYTYPPLAPVVSTLAATGVTPTSATLNGTVNPSAAVTTEYFQYGTTTAYGNYSATNTLAATNGNISISDLISNLLPDTTYHFQLAALNSIGTTLGADMTFITSPPLPPAVSTLAATGVSATSATLNGTVNPNTATTTAYIQYGLTMSYGNLTTTTSLIATNGNISISNPISGLIPGTTYHFQVVGINSSGTTAGVDMTFTTSPFLPLVTTLAATDATALSATLNGTVNPDFGATTAYFQYGLDTNYGDIGGFAILPATNATLSMPPFMVSSITGPGGSQWTQSSAPSAVWYSIASSADGTRLVAVVAEGGIYTSTNGGETWTQSSAPNQYWYSVASSADGMRLAAVVAEGGIYTSTNSGVTWTQSSAPTEGWLSIASSADGTQLAAVAGGAGIYTSTDGGGTWTQSDAPGIFWQSIASSADGTRLAMVSYTGGIYTSTNSGGTWTQSSAPSTYWQSIASSADGTRLASAVFDGGIWTSTDSGATWTQSSAPDEGWQTIASSADGARLAAVVYNGGVWTSTNSGATWTQSSAPDESWQTIASSADGTRLAAGVYSGGIYTSTGEVSSLSLDTTYHFRLVGINGGGTTLGEDMAFTTGLTQPVNIKLTGSIWSSGGAFQLSFSNLGGLSFTVLSATNLTLPLSHWTALGTATEVSPGQYQFTDLHTTNYATRFYLVRSP